MNPSHKTNKLNNRNKRIQRRLKLLKVTILSESINAVLENRQPNYQDFLSQQERLTQRTYENNNPSVT